ncbi:hypothetical protein [Tenacibaculum piscium]|uniref:Putative cytoplasmic protein n=1 Tax=Tenacibaculum piscium TaxID=1458515 RepID=A0A2H1YGC1_9FLAO|nr:hypothetical protein [Tenacibaculum piscium]MBE7630513.1 hypothetical protein [Tenacibaculum piscium]MBE7671707.1 hypothetical protein [Tenacibaculum piscium]MBE7691275.1 hypothetical protein [Tenacibaculum piscium]SOS74572.1 putative cytoplasmic protein [Tenacibaculum piscium]
MKNEQEKKQAAAFQKCKLKATNEIKTCFHPDCNENSINTHILQKNGILSSLENERHLMEMGINPFLDEIHYFNRIGINKAYSFKCFCNTHDTDLFKEIETDEINFSNYHHLILFTLRTIYNEKFRKLVNVRMRELLIAQHPNLFDIDFLKKQNEGEKLGLLDIEKTENLIWNDINENTESFVFETREINRIELCLTGFYNYETTRELEDYRKRNGKDKEDVIDIFINVFPYKDKTTIILGYKKKHKSDVKSYVNTLIKESEKRFLRQLTNLLMFRCETWVISEKFYKKRIKKCESYFGMAAHYSNNNYNERKFFVINLFEESFCEQMKRWKKNVG